MISSNDLRKGTVIRLDGELYKVIWFQHHKPGKGGAVVRTKLKNLLRDAVVEKTFRAGEDLEDVMIETRPAQLLYKEGQEYVFMDTETYEQFHVPEEVVDEASKYLKNEMICDLSFYDGQVISVEPPMFVELEIVETDPGLRGDTVSGGSKPATLETGAVVQVPLFVQVGEKIRVDTRDDRYIERVK
ncbi:elongation factor P [Thermospira aquatica]|uniref:Elongation factor P n=1 Tax=Thermospira aquatica TaxID=2828656 RepID=A0AAX3BCP6_9SPIR|nr:elongation factor P [Thermospira aquatica]URA10040.1 elongation factor P [Thermospira aquatica]